MIKKKKKVFQLTMRIGTGKSFSEALILESVNPQYDKRFFIDLRKIQVHNMLWTNIVLLFSFWHSKQYLYTTCCELVFFGEFNEQSLVKCGLTDSRMRASGKNLPTVRAPL